MFVETFIDTNSEHALQMLDPIVFHKINAFLSPAAPQNVNCLSGLS